MEAELASEATIVELQARIQELEQLHEADKAELQALRQSEEQANVQLQDVKEENEKLKEQTKEAKEAAHDATKSKDSVDAEKRQLLDALARADSDKQDLESESRAECPLADPGPSLQLQCCLQGSKWLSYAHSPSPSPAHSLPFRVTLCAPVHPSLPPID